MDFQKILIVWRKGKYEKSRGDYTRNLYAFIIHQQLKLDQNSSLYWKNQELLKKLETKF